MIKAITYRTPRNHWRRKTSWWEVTGGCRTTEAKFVIYQEATVNIPNQIKRGSETTEHGGDINSSIMLFMPMSEQPHKLATKIPVELPPYQLLKPQLHKFMPQ